VSPGGHLLTTAVAGGAVFAGTGSIPLTAGLVVGGFLIDVDHVVDYLLVERQRELTPAAFLRHYTEGHARRMVLAFHSYEVFLALAALAWWLGSGWLTGYLAGGVMHLVLDIGFNGRLTPRNIFAFYSFGFRWAHGFDALALFGSEPRVAPPGFWQSFFLGPRLARPRVGRRPAVPRRAPGVAP
jgi:hypothetical protein